MQCSFLDRTAKRNKVVPAFFSFFLLAIVSFSSFAETYYVDLSSGDNNADGKTRATAWRHIPGTRTSGLRSSPLCSNFGNGSVVAGSIRLGPGTIIKLKCGRHNGGAVLIDPTFYESGTAQQPVILEGDSTWGSGDIVFEGSGIGLQGSEGVIAIEKLDGIQLRGSNRRSRIVINNSPQRGITIAGTSSRPLQNIVLADILIKSMRSFGIDAKSLNSYRVERVTIDGGKRSGNGGFHFGTSSCNNGFFSACTASNLGDSPGAQRGGADIQIGFWLVNART